MRDVEISAEAKQCNRHRPGMRWSESVLRAGILSLSEEPRHVLYTLRLHSHSSQL